MVVPFAELDTAVDAMVEKITACSPIAIQRVRSAIGGMEWMGFNEALACAKTQIAASSATSDARGGLAAFVEKRAASWVIKKGEGND